MDLGSISALTIAAPNSRDAALTAAFSAYGLATGTFFERGVSKIAALCAPHRAFDCESQYYRLRSGLERLQDEFISTEIGKRMGQQERPLDVLEVGAGRSYGQKSEDYGAPWLARRLAAHFGSRIRITASDIIGTDQAVCILSIREQLQVNDLTLDSSSKLSFSQLGTNGVFCVQEITRLPRESASKGRFQDQLREIDALVPDPISPNAGARWAILRPALDPVVEGLFGVEVIQKINYLNPASLGRRKFDFVFARHLMPSELPQAEAIQTALSSVLRPGGGGVICIDGGVHINRDKVLVW